MRKRAPAEVMPAGLKVRVLRSGESEMALLSFTPTRPSRLTEAERDVALAVARGLSNAAIASLRNASTRTIANQVAAIMKKLGVTSRVELAAELGLRDFA